MKKMLVVGGLAVAFFLTACDKDKDNNEVNATDQMFLTQVNIGNRAEVMAGQLAAAKGTHPAVVAFGNHMIVEHTQAQMELQTVATQLGMALGDTVDAEHRALMERLSSLSGYAFDTAYINSQVKDHQKTLNIFQMEVNSGNNASVRTYALGKVSHIQMHLERADSIQRAL